jgi:hypothetical protein
MVDPELAKLLEALPWPQAAETYLYKQLFVLRSTSEP